MEITERAYAKINPVLCVTGRRPDGYHLLRMVMQTISLHDTLVLRTIQQPEVRLQMRMAGEDAVANGADTLGTGADNLICRAAQAMREQFHIEDGVEITLTKRIPLAAGLAGGSADAAAALRGINRLFVLGADRKRLEAIALTLGADVPFCVSGGTKLCEGIGEIMTDLTPFPECTVLVAKPDAFVSSAEAYRQLDEAKGLHTPEMAERPDADAMLRAIESGDLAAIAAAMGNDLAIVTESQVPAIAQIRALMEGSGAHRAMMSGSGPAVFGLFARAEQAKEAVLRLRESGLCPEIHLAVPQGAFSPDVFAAGQVPS